MKTILPIAVLLTLSNVIGQQKDLAFTDLVGSWKVENIKTNGEFEIGVLKRSRTQNNSIIYNFYSNGNFEIVDNRVLKSYRYHIGCGTPSPRAGRKETVRGTYVFDERSKRLKLKANNKVGQFNTWELVWIDKNTLRIVPNKPKTISLSN